MYCHAMCCKLCSICQRTVIIAIVVAGTFIGWSIELHCLNMFLILLLFGKENEKKKKMNLTKHYFFFAVTTGIVHFQLLSLVYLRVNYIFFFLRGKWGAATPQEPLSYTYDKYYIQCFTSLMFNNKNLVTLKGQLLKVQFSELQYSC